MGGCQGSKYPWGRNFIERLIDFVLGYEEVIEIPKGRRYVIRTGLGEIFKDGGGGKSETRELQRQ